MLCFFVYVMTVFTGAKITIAGNLPKKIYSKQKQFFHPDRKKCFWYISGMRWLFICILLHTVAHTIAQVNRNGVVIDEIMADPAPVAGLPDAEFIELKNVSLQPVNLNGWKINDATSTATISQNFVLQPDSFVLICSTGSRAVLSVYGHVLGITGFPLLDNNGEVISLKSKEGKLIHAVQYSKKWYGNDVKS